MRILSFTPVSFDSPSDSITQQDARTLQISSRTTGDADGVDIVVEGEGTVSFNCDRAHEVFDTKKICRPDEPDFRRQGGIDAFVSATRYPEETTTMLCQGEFAITPSATETPYFIKVIQTDGEIAWSSPYYVSNGSPAS